MRKQTIEKCENFEHNLKDTTIQPKSLRPGRKAFPHQKELRWGRKGNNLAQKKKRQ